MDNQELQAFRLQKDEFFRTNSQSPIPREDRAAFEGLDYYDYDPALDFRVEADEFEDKDDLQMQTSTGELRAYQRWGEFSFEVDGETARLTIYFSPHNGYFFLPFMDATSGKETYGAGRYLDIEPEGSHTFRVDFNLAYNPYCAYNPTYSCPIPPPENRLTVPIRAGEKHSGE